MSSVVSVVKREKKVIGKLRARTKRIYLEAEKWGQSKHCIRDLAIITFISSTIIPFPIEALLIAIITAAPKRWVRAALAATLGSVAGATVCYILGRFFISRAIKWVEFISGGVNLEEVEKAMLNEGIWYVGVAAFTPGLFRVGMVAAGVLAVQPLLFILSVLMGRGIRFTLEAALLRLFGDRLRSFLEKYFDVVSLGLGAVAIVIMVIIKLIR